MIMENHIYIESGLQIDMSGFKHFRFETCAGHKKLSNIKEIDFGWWDHHQQCLMLVELKGLHKVCPEKRLEKATALIENLWKKTIDVWLMLCAVWLDSRGGDEIKTCFPAEIHNKCHVRIFHLINCDRSFEMHLPFLNTKLKHKLDGYHRLFDNILEYRIISSRQAETKLFIDKETNRAFIKIIKV